MIGNLYGPVPCKRHDCYLLRRSMLHEKLAVLLAQFPVDYLCYGDAAYPLLRYITRGARRIVNPGPNDAQAVDNNRKMSKVDTCSTKRR